MAGVNRSNVAVTDTFDTWRIRTNEVNTTLNEATNAITANTIIFRDDSSNYIANTATLNAIAVTHGTTTSAVTVTSALAAASDGTKASILTTGGIYATLDSKFAADLTVGVDLSVEGNTAIGSAATDDVEFKARIKSGTHIVPIANNSSNLGSAALQFQQVYSEQNLIVATQDINANVFSVTSANGAGHTAVLKNDATVTGTVLQVLSNSSDGTGTRDIAKIVNDNTGATGATALHIQSDAGRALFIENTLAAGGYALEIDADQTTGGAVKIDTATTGGGSAKGVEMLFPALTTGKGLDVKSTSSNLGTGGAVVEISQSSGTMSSANSAVLSVNQEGEGTYGLKIYSHHASANSALRIDSIAETKNVIEVVDNSLSSGDILNMSTSAAHSGQMISLTSSATGDTARGEALLIDYRTANTSANAIRVTDGTADTFTVSSKGDVTMAGNLNVQGTTTQINTTTTLARDKSIILGAQSAIVTGATYTAADPPVVTSASHGLTNGQAIFVVSSSATSSGTVAVPSENLFLVANKTDDTFELEAPAENVVLEDATVTGDATGFLLLDQTDGTGADAGDNIIMQEEVDATGDSNRTFSWVGPQTDAAVDDSGIIIPGSTAVHSVKWDDTDNYWKLDDSVKVDSSGQFVFPKGTTADRPAATITGGTLAAATPGAMRFNTSSSKFEAIETGTTFQNMSTESFSIAVAIALG